MREGRDRKEVVGNTLGSNQGMEMSGSVLGSVESSREVDPASLKIDASLIEKQRIVFTNNPEEISGTFDAFMGSTSVRLATAGYSAAPSGYEEPTTEFLSELLAALGDDVGLITSPTCDKGSIDAITTTVGQRAGALIGYITADSYLAYIKPDSFPADIDQGAYSQQLKFAFPDAAVYSRATAVLSNSFLVTGGRNASVNDFMNAVTNGNKVVVLLNEQISSPAWDAAKSRVDNAAEYLLKMIQGNHEGIPLEHEFNAKVHEFVQQHRGAILDQVIFVNATAEGSVTEAVAHLTGGKATAPAPQEQVVDLAPAEQSRVAIPGSFREWAENFCFERGMFPEDAKVTVDNLIASPVSDPMRGRWDDQVKDYPSTLLPALAMALQAEAVLYIEKNCPNAWFKPLFDGSAPDM